MFSVAIQSNCCDTVALGWVKIEEKTFCLGQFLSQVINTIDCPKSVKYCTGQENIESGRVPQFISPIGYRPCSDGDDSDTAG